jgi:glycosyltransferase involved in cell wall biosynthesis/predicted SAM-dependent methyltransferase
LQITAGKRLERHCHRRSGLLLNVGCGNLIERGWINIDIGPYPGAFYFDALDPFPVADLSVRHIHCEHFFDYFSFGDAIQFLNECYRVLEPGGFVRIIVADLEHYIQAYTADDNEFFDRLAYHGGAVDRLETKAMVCNQSFRDVGHNFSWDHETLEYVSQQIGFRYERSSHNKVAEEFAIDGQDWWRPFESLYANLHKPRKASSNAESIPRISFVVPVYNMEPYVAECLDSIFAQDGDHDYEVIIIDDASTDASAGVIARFDDPRIRFNRHRENLGAARTITEGLLAARGIYVARIDPDDRYRPHFLNRTVEILNRHPDVGLVYGRIAMIDGNGAMTDPGTGYPSPPGSPKADRFLNLLKRNDLPAPTVLARREAWTLGLPIPSRFEFNDWYLSLSIAEQWQTYFVDEVLADYRVHPNSMSHVMIRDRWAEPIIIEVLERILGSPGREEEKRRHRNEIYAAQYRQLADEYFGCDLLNDARRCYWAAIRRRPDQHIRPDVLRRLLGTYVGRRRYEGMKAFANRMRKLDPRSLGPKIFAGALFWEQLEQTDSITFFVKVF